MQRTRSPFRVRTLLVAGVALVACPVPGDAASASCAAPSLLVRGDRDAREPVLTAGSELTIAGRGFVTGCDDSRIMPAGGCSAPEPLPTTESPRRHVVLVLRQGRRVWRLGTADAGTTAEQRLGQVSWTVRLPHLRTGAAVLAAVGAEPLRVRVRPGA